VGVTYTQERVFADDCGDGSKSTLVGMRAGMCW
jgi:hypothetical protein